MTAFHPMKPIDQFSMFHAWLDPFVRALCTAPQADPPADAPDTVRAHIVGRIDSLVSEGRAGAAAEKAREIRYLMAAFADEILIASRWPHREQWLDWLVEEKMFGSRHAGDRVFERIDALVRSGEAQRRDMALPYLFALALGFRGCAASGADGDRMLARTRHALFQLAQEREPDPAFGAAPDALDTNVARRVMFRPYQTIASAGVPVLLPSPLRWRNRFVLAFVLLLAAGSAIWWVRTDALRRHFQADGQAASGAVLVSPESRP